MWNYRKNWLKAMLQIAVMWLLQWKKAGGFDNVNDQTSNNCDFTVLDSGGWR